MILADEVYDASVVSSMLNTSGTQAQPGENVATWQSQTSNSRTATQSTAAAQPILGVDADRSPTGVRPLTFRGSQSLPTFALPAQMQRYTIFALTRLKAGVTGSRYIVGTPGNYNLLQSSSATPGSVRAFIPQQDIEIDTTERVRMFTQNVQSTGLTFTGVQGREDTFNTTASGVSLLTGQQFFLGNSSGTNAGGLLDLFAFAVVPANVGRANQQRMEGYLAHRAGLASVALDPSHPYYSAPPMVPEGTTSTLDWIELPSAVAARQTFLGGYIEIQPDSYNGAGTTMATDSTSEAWGFPYSLTASERARFKAELFGPVNPRYRHIRLPWGFAVRGFRNIDSATGLAKNIGERVAGQMTAVSDMISNVIPLGGGFWPEYWSPAPYWKTTSSYAGGRLWAGGTYSRDTSLESIRTSDPTQYNAQIEAVTSAMLDDLEYFHQTYGPIRGFGVGNEVISTVNQTYGTWNTSTAEYQSLERAVLPKIRASSILSTYGGQPNFVHNHGESLKGFDNAGSTFSSTALLSTGKTVLGETSYMTLHEITAISENPDYIRSQASTLTASARGKPIFVNEFEYFTLTGRSDELRFARTCAQQLHNLNLLGAPIVMTIIHALKDIGVSDSTGSAIGYALAKMRLPAPFGQDPSTPGDPAPQLGHGQFEFVKPNWHAGLFVMDNVPVGSVIRRVDLPTKADGTGSLFGIAAAALVLANGKRRMLVVNFTSTPSTFRTTLGTNATFNVVTYTATDAAVSAGTISGPNLSMTFAPYTAYVITET